MGVASGPSWTRPSHQGPGGLAGVSKRVVTGRPGATTRLLLVVSTRRCTWLFRGSAR